MTTLREAAQQALEALELAHLNGRSKLRRQKLVDSIYALRATLAQPDPVMCSNTFACQCPKHFTALRAALAEPRPIHECYGDCPTNPQTCPNPCNFEGRPRPVQEPVAWSFEARHIDTAFGPAVSIRHPGREHKYMRNVRPLYAAPPQRKPLTDDELLETLQQLDPDAERLLWPFLAFARAIERAHGIT